MGFFDDAIGQLGGKKKGMLSSVLPGVDMSGKVVDGPGGGIQMQSPYSVGQNMMNLAHGAADMGAGGPPPAPKPPGLASEGWEVDPVTGQRKQGTGMAGSNYNMKPMGMM